MKLSSTYPMQRHTKRKDWVMQMALRHKHNLRTREVRFYWTKLYIRTGLYRTNAKLSSTTLYIRTKQRTKLYRTKLYVRTKLSYVKVDIRTKFLRTKLSWTKALCQNKAKNKAILYQGRHQNKALQNKAVLDKVLHQKIN